LNNPVIVINAQGEAWDGSNKRYTKPASNGQTRSHKLLGKDLSSVIVELLFSITAVHARTLERFLDVDWNPKNEVDGTTMFQVIRDTCKRVFNHKVPVLIEGQLRR
jgi:hypothetical protein